MVSSPSFLRSGCGISRRAASTGPLPPAAMSTQDNARRLRQNCGKARGRRLAGAAINGNGHGTDRGSYYSSQPMELQDRGAMETTFRMINAETQLLYSSD